MLPIVAPRGRRQGQPSCKRRRRRALGSLGDGVAVCRTRRVVSFGLIGRFLYVSWESGRTRLRVRLDDGAPAGMTWLSPKAVLARCLAPDIEALTSAPAFQQSYWSNQHAALVSRSVCRQQCPHPCFLPAATRSDSGNFAAQVMRARRGDRAALRFQLETSYAIEEWLSRAPPPQRLAQLQRETTPTAGRGLRADRHA